MSGVRGWNHCSAPQGAPCRAVGATRKKSITRIWRSKKLMKLKIMKFMNFRIIELIEHIDIEIIHELLYYWTWNSLGFLGNRKLLEISKSSCNIIKTSSKVM